MKRFICFAIAEIICIVALFFLALHGCNDNNVNSTEAYSGQKEIMQRILELQEVEHPTLEQEQELNALCEFDMRDGLTFGEALQQHRDYLDEELQSTGDDVLYVPKEFYQKGGE